MRILRAAALIAALGLLAAVPSFADLMTPGARHSTPSAVTSGTAGHLQQILIADLSGAPSSVRVLLRHRSTTVPEPSSLVLLIGALGAIGFGARRMKRATP